MTGSVPRHSGSPPPLAARTPGFRKKLNDWKWAVRRRTKPLEDVVFGAFEVGPAARSDFLRLRETAEYQAVFDHAEPLVSVCIATYNRADLLRRRSVQSLLEQTYRNIEIIVVGDCCTDGTAQAMTEIDDPRLVFVNLPQRGVYPEHPDLRWMVAGTAPVNHALTLARGEFVTHLDDDDEHAPDRIEKLLALIRGRRADFVFHPFRYEHEDGSWRVNPAARFGFGKVSTSSILYHRYFRNLPWDPRAYKYREPGDWNRLRKVAFLGARIERHPDILLTHHRERNQQAR